MYITATIALEFIYFHSNGANFKESYLKTQVQLNIIDSYYNCIRNYKKSLYVQ